ncbi:tyrosine-type recombinase/integrase [Aeoliella sp.]|uniref:tyrosine-type recombinase/integrase n=1 Tax=Aeoliella sp. TaxID=2795800 RepID=UPI003CCB8DA2
MEHPSELENACRHGCAWRLNVELMNELPSNQSDAPASVHVVGQIEGKYPPPDLIASESGAARFAWEEFVYGRIRNLGTRRAYCHAVERFLTWCQSRSVRLVCIAPAHVGRYLDEQPYAAATKKLHLSAIRHFFDELVLRHVVILNPAASVRGERLQAVEGKTPEISAKQCRTLLASINVSHVVGLRDRAIIAILIYTAARVGAVSRLRRRDFYDLGDQFCLRMTEKGTKHREIPVRHELRGFLLAYLKAGCLEYSDKSSSLFRTTTRRTKHLTLNRMTADDMGRMVKRRLRDAGLSEEFSPHSFRVATITDLLMQCVPMEEVQFLAGHSDPRTTRLYDRRQRQVTRNIVERISI